MVAIRTIGPRVSQWIQYNDATAGPTPALLYSLGTNGTVNLIAWPGGAGSVTHTNVHYDNLCSAGSWSYFDPPVSDARCDGPLLGQFVVYQSAAGPQHAFVAAVVPLTGAITLRTWTTSGVATKVVGPQYDYTGIIVGSWRYHDPSVGESRSVGPRISQLIVYTSSVNGLMAAFIVGVNSNGTINLVAASPVSSILSAPYDGTGLTLNTWRYHDPTVN